MFNRNYRLICLDLDGTLLDGRHEIASTSLKVLKRAQKKGYTIAIVTGRAAYDALAYGKEVSSKTYYIGSNGSIVGEVKGNKVIREEVLSSEKLKLILEFSDRHALKPMFFTADKLIITSMIDYLTHLFLNVVIARRSVRPFHLILSKKKLNRVLKDKDTKVHKAMYFIRGKGKAKKIEKLLRKDKTFELAITSKFCFEITSKGMNKRQGVACLAGHLGIDKSEIIAFGDSENDYEMLKYAGMGVAMGNASKEVKAIADYVTDTNNNNGIANVLEKII